jgi:hypothetical protein
MALDEDLAANSGTWRQAVFDGFDELATLGEKKKAKAENIRRQRRRKKASSIQLP